MTTRNSATFASYDTELTSAAKTGDYWTYTIPDGNTNTVGADMSIA